ncbi:MAG TPA: SGNH/GDSL hydrolase family protein, partial [Planctomycetota bacterium]|nr:SGNH/GDSL hydrolase family protein [Planctomycetota bacterium]
MSRRSWRRLALTLCAPLACLLLPELVLALAGVRAPRYAGFLDPGAYWVPVEVEGQPAGLQRAFPRQYRYVPEPLPLFLRDKPADGWRVFVLGESSVAGLPYDVGCFTDWLRLRASAMLPGRTVEVVNAGNVGWHASDERTLLRECLEHEPDLLIWMVGHNEFVPHNVLTLRLEHERPVVHALSVAASRSRTVRWLSERVAALRPRRVSTFADQLSSELPIYGPERPLIEERFREATAGAVSDAQAAGVPIVLCTLARNLSASPPSSSTFSEETRGDGDRRARWDAAYEQGLLALDRGDAVGALAALRAALALDGRPAKLVYALGRALALSGRPALAAAAFEQALEQDAAPMRAQAWVERTIRDVARQSGAPLADVQARFDAAGAVGVAGGELILDNCHPNLAGHELIASVLLTVLEQQLGVPFDRSLDISREDGRRRLGLDEYESQVSGRVESLCLVKLALYGGEVDDLWRQARASCAAALVQDPADWEVSGSLGLLEALAGNGERARSLIEQAMANNPYVRTSYVFYWRTEPRYERVFDAAGLDMAA